MALATIGMICLGLYLLLVGAQQLFKLSFEAMPIIQGILALVAGVLILVGLL